MDEELRQGGESSSNTKWMIAAAAALLLVILGLALYLFLKSDSPTAVSMRSNFFGSAGTEEDIRPAPVGPGVGTPGNYGDEPSDKPFFRQLSKIPTAGSYFYTTTEGLRMVRYVAKENGHVYDINIDSGVERKISNTTIPRVHEALFGDNGNVIVVRSLETDPYTKQDVVKTFFGRLTLPKDMTDVNTVGSLNGSYFKDGVSAVTISPNGKRLFYLLPKQDGYTIGNTVDIASGEPKEVFRHQFSEWLPQILDTGKIVMTTKPSARIPGFSYLYDPANGDLKRLVRERSGLVTLSDSTAKHMLFSENIAANAVLSVHGEVIGDEGVILNNLPLSLTTIAEKCAWTKNDQKVVCAVYSAIQRKELPDDWYKGSFFFEDSFWSVDMTTREPVLLADPSLMQHGPFDATALSVSPDESAIFFIDKRDETLWMLGMPQPKSDVVDAATEEELRDIEGSGVTGKLSTTTPKR